MNLRTINRLWNKSFRDNWKGKKAYDTTYDKGRYYESETYGISSYSFLAPLLTFLYECTNFFVAYRSNDSSSRRETNRFMANLLYDKQFILSLTIPLSITLAASVIANTEHQGNAWKQLLALPIKRSSIFVGKFYCYF
ncbi:ABC transporter permease subunit [Bacillus megaterium]|nr:ABC transporter permease subunit [Priestia megaterium]